MAEEKAGVAAGRRGQAAAISIVRQTWRLLSEDETAGGRNRRTWRAGGIRIISSDDGVDQACSKAYVRREGRLPGA